MLRDNQRQKVYRAESYWNRNRPIHRPSDTIMEPGGSTAELEALYDMLAEHYGTERPRIVINPRLRAWAGITYFDRVEFCDGVSVFTALHEFGHWMDRGHKHDWKFTSNMIDIVGLWYGAEEAEDLKGAYRKYGVVWHYEDQAEKEQMAKAAQERRYERHGETGAVYLLLRVQEDNLLYRCNGHYHSYYLSQATVWRRKTTAMQKALESINYKYDIWEAKGEFDAYENRWYAKSLVGPAEGLVVPA